MKDATFSFRNINLDQGSLELTEEYIRERAYQIYEQRGRRDGHDVEDWLQAESEIVGRKPALVEKLEQTESRALIASAA
jgi:hypothetical protein